MSTVLPKFLEWYEIDGVEFANHGYSISSISKGHAEHRGNNVETPSVHGVQWREKRLAARAETWNIWITDNEPTSGSVAATEELRRQQFNTNYDTVMRVLTKLPSLMTVKHYRRNGGSTAVRVGYAEIASAFNIDDHKDLNVAQFSVEAIFPDPRWYDESNLSPSLTATISSGTSASVACSQTQVGTAPVTYMTVTFTATSGYTLVNPRLTNSTYASSTSVIGYTGSIASTTSVVIDTDALTCKTGTGTNVISGLYRYGARQDWMELFPTTNSLAFTCTSGRGTVTIAYKRAYI